jgi:hypothetical protein
MDEPTDDPIPEVALTEIPSKLTLNKNGKPRKQLDQNALDRLSKAREKANAIRKQNTVKKLEQKVEKMKVGNQDIAGNQIDPPECATDPQDLGGNVVEQEPEVKVEKIKTKSKKKPQIIVEQSSDDEDEFEPNDKVIFVKRVTRKKKEPEPEPEPPPVIRQEPPPDVPKPKPNPLQRQYDAMFSGSFLNQPRRPF